MRTILFHQTTLMRTPDPRIGGPIEVCFDGEKEEPRSTVERGPALTKPGLLSRAELGPHRSVLRWGKGGRSLQIWSFRGSYGNRGSGMEQASSDVVERRNLDTNPGRTYWGPIEARFDGEKEEPRSTVEGGPALTKPGLLSRAEGAPTWWS